MLFERCLGQGPDLVLLHGWGMNTTVWDDLADQLAERYRVHLIDLPGHGRSPWPDGLNGLDDWTRTLLQAAPERAVWIGWSLGGSLALQAALSAPRRVQALCLVTATPRFIRAPDWPAAIPPRTLAGFHDELLADPHGTLGQFLALQVRGGEAARDLLRRLRSRLRQEPEASPQALAAGLDLLRDIDLRADLNHLSQPSLWLYGDRDTLVPAASAEQLAELLPQASLRTLTGSAHAPFLSHPQPALELLMEFLEQHA